MYKENENATYGYTVVIETLKFAFIRDSCEFVTFWFALFLIVIVVW